MRVAQGRRVGRRTGAFVAAFIESARRAGAGRVLAASGAALFIESAIMCVVSARVLSAALFCAFLHAPAAMTTSATANAMRFMRAPVEVRVGKTAKRT